jgi:hypothetical protein
MAALAGASGDPGGDMKKRRTRQSRQVVQRDKRLSPDDCMSSLCELFGAAAYYAQRFEAALKDFLLVYSQLVNDTATADALQAMLEKKTMGHLLRRIRDVVIIRSDWPDGLLDHALERRNYLMHEFFLKHEQELRVPDAQPRLAQELAELGYALKAALIMTRGMTNAIQQALEHLERCDDEAVTVEMSMSDDAIELVRKLTFSPLQNA